MSSNTIIMDAQLNQSKDNSNQKTAIDTLKTSINAREALMHEVEKAVKDLPIGGRVTIKGIVGLPGLIINIGLDWGSEDKTKVIYTAIISDIIGGALYTASLAAVAAIGTFVGVTSLPAGVAVAGSILLAMGIGAFSDWATDKVWEMFDQAQSTRSIFVDPILIDLNGDGIKTTTVEDGMYFDHQKDGFAEKSAWANKEDGILAIDRNGDGIINDGGEIFGDNYVKSNGDKASSGFDALRDLDSNNDGVINANDEAFSQIKILKGDGELISLEETGIVSINLNLTAKNMVDENGNTLVSSSTFTKADGSVGNLGDFNLVVDKMNSFATEWLDESEDITALPEVLGSGMVHSLHQAMVRDESGELKGLVEEFIAASGVIQKKNVLLQILYKWTGADGVAEGSRGDNFDAKKLYVLEKFIGKGYVGTNGSNPHAQAAGVLNNAFNVLVNNIYASLMSQTELKDMFDLLEIVYDKDTNTVSYDLCKVREYIDNLIAEDEIRGKQLFSDFTHSFVHLGLRDNSNYTEYYNYFVSKGADYKYLLQAVDKNVIQGTDEADIIEGTTGADAVLDFDYYLNRNNNQKIA